MVGTVLDPVKKDKVDDGKDNFFGWKTTLFNCNCHSFDQVEGQLIKAVRCTKVQAGKFAKEIHSKGCAIVYSGVRERCEAVSMTLDQIGLVTSVTQ